MILVYWLHYTFLGFFLLLSLYLRFDVYEFSQSIAWIRNSDEIFFQNSTQELKISIFGL